MVHNILQIPVDTALQLCQRQVVCFECPELQPAPERENVNQSRLIAVRIAGDPSTFEIYAILSVEWRSFLSQGLDLVRRLYRNHTQDIQIRRLSRAAVVLAHDETAHAMNVNVFPQLRIQVRQKRKPRRRGTLIRHGPDPRRAVAPQHSSVTPPASGSGASTAGWPALPRWWRDPGGARRVPGETDVHGGYESDRARSSTRS